MSEETLTRDASLLSVENTEGVGVAQPALPALNHHHNIALLQQAGLNTFFHTVTQTGIYNN